MRSVETINRAYTNKTFTLVNMKIKSISYLPSFWKISC